MNIQYAYKSAISDNKADISVTTFGSDNPWPSSTVQSAKTYRVSSSVEVNIENSGSGDEEEITPLPLEAMVISNSSPCAFMGARSPWANA
jgi:hypothetical protein